MTLRLYLDEDAINHGLIVALRAHAVDLVTVAEAGLMERDDEAQLEFATAEGRILYTFNAGDFRRILAEFMAQAKSHAGIVIGRQDFSIGEQLRGLLWLRTSDYQGVLTDQAVFLSNLLRERAADEAL